jgi:D-psicose/D-tagatose/L-ribulose 3-epimerase
MNKTGIYYAYWERNWDADFLPYVKKVADLGFDILEVNSGTVTRMSNDQRNRLKAEAEKYSIGLTFCIGLTAEYDIASESRIIRLRGIEFLKRQAEMLDFMGAKTLGGILYSSWPGSMPPGITDKRPFLDRSVASMKEVMKTAGDLDVFFNMEVVNRFEQYLINTCREALSYVEQVGSNNCRIMLDSFHMNIEEDNIYDAIILAAGKLGHVHIGETNRMPPGTGRFPWDELMKGLADIGYRGAIVMEPFITTGGEVGRDIRIFRDLGAGIDPDGAARKALEFIREKNALYAGGYPGG